MRVFLATLTCLGLTAGVASAAQFTTPPSQTVSRSIIRMGSQADFDALERTRAEEKANAIAPKKKTDKVKQTATSADPVRPAQRTPTPVATSTPPASADKNTDPLLRQALEGPSSGPLNTASHEAPPVTPVAAAEPDPSPETTTAIPRATPVADSQQVAPVVNHSQPAPVSAPAQNPFPSAGADAPSTAPQMDLSSMPSPVTGTMPSR